MKRLIFVLLLFAGELSPLRAEPFEQAEVIKAINLVSLLPQSTRAVRGDVVKGNTGLKTGNDSRAELQFPDFTITRVGSNSLFRFVAGTREIILDGGTMLFSAPKGAGGGKVRAGSITAAVTGSDFMISNVGRVKVICLSHKVTVYLTANPKIRAELLPGQMLDIAAGADRKMPRITTINLGKLLATSKLSESGGFRALPSQHLLAQNTNKQGKAFELATVATNNSPSQSSQTVATAITARDAADTTSPADTTGNNVNPGNSSNNVNPGNSSNNVNPGNSSNNVNPGNSGNNGNPGNSGNNGNPGNSGNNGNPGNSGNNVNRGNSGNNVNRGNSGNNGNPGNSGNSGNRGNSGNNGNPGNSGNNVNRGNSGNNGNGGNSAMRQGR